MLVVSTGGMVSTTQEQGGVVELSSMQGFPSVADSSEHVSITNEEVDDTGGLVGGDVTSSSKPVFNT